MKRVLAILSGLMVLGCNTYAGNPDRRGEAGAYELNMNGWARSSGFWTMNTASISGLEAERLNVAGLASTKKTEIIAAYTLWLQGSGVGLAHVGVAQGFKEVNTVALTIQALNFGAIERTTTQNPEGGIGTFRPTFLNIGVSFAREFSNSISGGVTLRLINEGLGNVNAFGFSVDAGLQYVTGPKDNLHFGVSLRNVGTPMKFKGDALANTTGVQIVSATSYTLTTENKSNKFELPTQLNIGAAYDIWMGKKKEVSANVYKQDYRLSWMANFSSNAFGNDHYGLGVEFGWKQMLMLRAAYRFESGLFKESSRLNVYSGLAAGFTFDAPLKKDGSARLGIDYSYRATYAYKGTHSIGLRFAL